MTDRVDRWLATGGAVGFVITIGLLIFDTQTPLIVYTLWPFRILTYLFRSSGTLAVMWIRILAVVLNIGMYSLIGLGFGKLIGTPTEGK